MLQRYSPFLSLYPSLLITFNINLFHNYNNLNFFKAVFTLDVNLGNIAVVPMSSVASTDISTRSGEEGKLLWDIFAKQRLENDIM